MYTLGFYPLNDNPARVTNSSATLIDNIFTNELCHSLFNAISDHLPIFALCEYNINRNIVKEFQHIRKIADDTLASYSNELNQQSWDNDCFKYK